jgi:hypothetical protein
MGWVLMADKPRVARSRNRCCEEFLSVDPERLGDATLNLSVASYDHRDLRAMLFVLVLAAASSAQAQFKPVEIPPTMPTVPTLPPPVQA